MGVPVAVVKYLSTAVCYNQQLFTNDNGNMGMSLARGIKLYAYGKQQRR